MKEKSQIEKKAEEKQITLLSTALSEASNAGGHWLNASGKGYPRFYPRGVSVSAFNALFMTLHSDKKWMQNQPVHAIQRCQGTRSLGA